MTNLRSRNDFISRIANGYDANESFYGQIQANVTGNLCTGQAGAMIAMGYGPTFPSLPAGVTGYIVTSIEEFSSTGTPVVIGKAINLGNIDVGSGTFTAGSSMPSITAGNISTQLYSAPIAVVTTALNSAPGSVVITYNANDGTTGNASVSTGFTASAAINTAGTFQLNAGHWGLSQITNITHSGGTTPSGVVTFYGLIPICMLSGSNSTLASKSMLSYGMAPIRWAAADVLGTPCFVLGSNSSRAIVARATIVGDS